ncbi:hypothetical protein BVRB_014900 [Beta vulgaris subsp. vulgaris]|uniref:Uncharacterized protein n=1 Tax=Beta vulgaris subsp. vulgaris TaxID=3555 RepID=A0A0J8B1G0_BETVV|nr:hypothetical protein BVRB_014900 [Beta vulgaris subsp. vulgaris]
MRAFYDAKTHVLLRSPPLSLLTPASLCCRSGQGLSTWSTLML